MPPAWKVRRGHLVIGSSVRPSVCPSVCPSVRNSVPLTIKVQYLKFGWWYSNQTWTVSSSKGCSHFTDITRPWGVGQGQNVGLRNFCHNWTLLPPGASVFHKHMSSFFRSDCQTVFSSPEPKARVSYCHSAPSVVRSSVRPSSVVVRPCGVNFSHFRLLLQNCLMDFDETW